MDLATRQALEKEREALRDTINQAYWRFTRQARAKPPSMQCPEAYRRLAEVHALLRGATRTWNQSRLSISIFIPRAKSLA